MTELTCSWDLAKCAEFTVMRGRLLVDVCEASCCRCMLSCCRWCGVTIFTPRPCGSWCSAVDLGVLEMSAAGSLAQVTRGAVGRRGTPGLKSFGERNLGLRAFGPLVTHTHHDRYHRKTQISSKNSNSIAKLWQQICKLKILLWNSFISLLAP